MLHNNKFILNGILAFSIFSLVIAYYVQYILGHKLKKFLGWQLWGYIRKLNEHKKIFQEVGLNILKEGADERGRQFFLLTRGNHL